MKLEQFVQGLKDKTITFDTCGHSVDIEYQIKNILDKLSSGIFTKYWDENRDISLNILMVVDWFHCHRCSQYSQWSMIGNTLTLNRYVDPVARSVKTHDAGHRCEFETIKPYVGKINITSKLIVANYFNNIVPELPDNVRHSSAYCINYWKGRVLCAEHMEKHNVAYGSMGNMSIGVFVHPNKKSVIIGNRWHEESDSKIGQIEDHVYVGSVCLDAWCWEATDLTTIGDNQYNAKNSVECDVEHGEWQFEHFYDMDRENESEDDCEDESPIYSKFTFIEA